jgi:AcrR family transcriptional regulator
MTMPKNAARLTREKWLKFALESLVREGGAKLRIDNMVKELGVSKGSFYWHFDDRMDFVHSLLDYWHEADTLSVPQHIGIAGTAEERLLKLITFVFEHELTKYDLAIRSWAIQEAEIRPLLRRTDVFRHNFVRSLFAEMGFDKHVADMRTRVLVAYLALYGAVFDQLSRAKQLGQIQDLHAMLVKPAG